MGSRHSAGLACLLLAHCVDLGSKIAVRRKLSSRIAWAAASRHGEAIAPIFVGRGAPSLLASFMSVSGRSHRYACGYFALLVHRRDRVIVQAVLRADSPALADPRRRHRRCADRLRCIPEGDRPSAAFCGGAAVQRWTVMERGGHFAAMERPEALAAEIRAFFREIR